MIKCEGCEKEIAENNHFQAVNTYFEACLCSPAETIKVRINNLCRDCKGNMKKVIGIIDEEICLVMNNKERKKTRWTIKPPIKDGFYWILFEQDMEDPHHQGPMVFDVTINDNKDLEMVEAGSDCIQTPEDYERTYEVKIKYWSDEPIIPPGFPVYAKFGGKISKDYPGFRWHEETLNLFKE